MQTQENVGTVDQIGKLVVSFIESFAWFSRAILAKVSQRYRAKP